MTKANSENEERRLTDVDDTVVGDLPAALQSQYAEGGGLFGREEAEGGVSHVVRLQGELVEGGKQLSHRPHRLVRHVDTVAEREADDARCEAGPQSGLRQLVTTCQLQFKQRL